MGDVLYARPCVVCGLIDTDPKHVVYLGDRADASHYDCHAAADPPCEVCAGQLVGAAGVTGAALRAHLMEGV